MKFINKIILSILALGTPLACDTDELHDRNINPQALGTVPMEYLFTAAQLGSASGGSAGDNRYIDWRTNIALCGYAIQQLAHTGVGGLAAGDKYIDNVESYNAPWEFIYGDQLKNLAEILRQTGPEGFDEGKENLRNAARILRVFNFHRLTDYYGNIPYTEALKGITDKNFTPAYDGQQAIYNDLLKELEEATAALVPLVSTNRDDQAFAAADLFYDGDISQWKKFGYSLMLRLAMRISNVDLAKANEFVGKAVTGGVFASNDDNIWVGMSIGPSEWVNQNGISRAFTSGDGGQPNTLSKTLIDELKGPLTGDVSDDDPRLQIFSRGINGNNDPLIQRGLPNGMDQGDVNEMEGVPANPGVNVSQTFSQLNLKLIDDDDPYLLMHYAESQFLLAEAAVRGIGNVSAGEAQTYYENGVRAAMKMYTPFDMIDNTLEVSDAEVDAYLAARPFPAASEARLEAIGTQMWVSKFMSWWEAWADWRRTQYPVLVPVNYEGNTTGGQIPRKLRIPNTEIAVNGANYTAGATLPDEPATKVWWDVK
jgi:hypothetical protein